MSKIYAIPCYIFIFLLTFSSVSTRDADISSAGIIPWQLNNFHSPVTPLHLQNRPNKVFYAAANYTASYKIKGKNRIRTKFRARYVNYKLIRIPVSSYQILAVYKEKNNLPHSLLDNELDSSHTLRGPPVI